MTLIPVTKNEMDRFERVPAGDMPANLYTCPMPEHADVVSDTPGVCPKCGMKLVPTASVPHGKQAEAKWRAQHPATASPTSEAMPGMPGMQDAGVTSTTQGTTAIRSH